MYPVTVSFSKIFEANIIIILFSLFMDLKNAYDTIDRHGMWRMQRVYGVGGKLLKAVQNFYVDSKA